MLHGTGGDENDLIPVGQILRPGAALLSLRGGVLENGVPRFFRRFAPGVFDQDDLVRRTHALAGFVEDQCSRRHLGKIVAVGYSNGATMAASLLLLRPGLLAGAVLFRAMLPLETPHPSDLGRVPVLLVAGRSDEAIPPASTHRLAVLLAQAGAELTLDWRDAGHEVSGDEFLRAAEWLGANFPAP